MPGHTLPKRLRSLGKDSDEWVLRCHTLARGNADAEEKCYLLHGRRRSLCANLASSA
jgi:hypothetical protein